MMAENKHKKVSKEEAYKREQEIIAMMYRDDQVVLDFPLPGVLKELVEEADKYFEAKDWFWYDRRVSELESSTKQYLLCGLINQTQFNRIWKRYGI